MNTGRREAGAGWEAGGRQREGGVGQGRRSVWMKLAAERRGKEERQRGEAVKSLMPYLPDD